MYPMRGSNLHMERVSFWNLGKMPRWRGPEPKVRPVSSPTARPSTPTLKSIKYKRGVCIFSPQELVYSV